MGCCQTPYGTGGKLQLLWVAGKCGQPAGPRGGKRMDKPTVVCLCGSTRFKDVFDRMNLEFTLQGKIVLSIGCASKSDAELFGSLSAREWVDTKEKLDILHRRKIDLADEVFIVNVDGYIGESTASEISYAMAHGKPVSYLIQ
jgi:hypothetical protein